MSFKKLPLKRETIESAIALFVDNKGIISKKQIGTNKTRFEIDFTDKAVKPALLDVDYNADGTTTIEDFRGQNQQYSYDLAKFIVENTQVVLYETGNLFFETITDEQFDYLTAFVRDNSVTISQETVTNGTKYVMSGRYGDKLTATRYNTGSILFQGRPSMTFNTAITALNDIYPAEVVLIGLQKYYRIDFPEADLSSEVNCRCPKLSAHLPDSILKTILPTFGLCRAIPSGLTDYSYLCFPLLRGLEGLIKEEFRNKGILIPLKSGFRGFLKYDDSNNTATVLPPHDSTIGDSNIQIRIEQLYVLLNEQRHRVFHLDLLAPLHLCKEDAVSIIEDTLAKIENAF